MPQLPHFWYLQPIALFYMVLEWEFLIWHLKHKKGLFLFAEREFEHTRGEIHRISEIINSLKSLKARVVRGIWH